MIQIEYLKNQIEAVNRYTHYIESHHFLHSLKQKTNLIRNGFLFLVDFLSEKNFSEKTYYKISNLLESFLNNSYPANELSGQKKLQKANTNWQYNRLLDKIKKLDSNDQQQDLIPEISESLLEIFLAEWQKIKKTMNLLESAQEEELRETSTSEEAPTPPFTPTPSTEDTQESNSRATPPSEEASTPPITLAPSTVEVEVKKQVEKEEALAQEHDLKTLEEKEKERKRRGLLQRTKSSHQLKVVTQQEKTIEKIVTSPSHESNKENFSDNKNNNHTTKQTSNSSFFKNNCSDFKIKRSRSYGEIESLHKANPSRYKKTKSASEIVGCPKLTN